MSDALYDLLAVGLARGEGAGLVNLAKNLVALEKGSERSTVALSVCLVRAGAYDDAERALRAYVEKNGAKKTAAVSTNLAKVSAARGDEGAALKELADALALDVNYEPALMWWASLVRKKLDDGAFAAALTNFAKKPGAWRVHLLLYGHHLQLANDAAATKSLHAALTASGPKPSPSSEIATSLARAKAWPALVQLYGAYNPSTHGLVAGEKLAQAHVSLGAADNARVVVAKMRAHKGAAETRALRDALAHLERAPSPPSSPSSSSSSPPSSPSSSSSSPPSSPSSSPSSSSSSSSPPSSPSSSPSSSSSSSSSPSSPSSPSSDVPIGVPVLAPLAGDRAKLAPLAAKADRIAFAVVVGGAVDVARAVPLALAESFRAAGADAYTLVLVVAKKGFLATSVPLTIDDTIALLPSTRLPRYLVTARVNGADLELTLSDLAKRTSSTTSLTASLTPAELAASAAAWVASETKLASAPPPSPAAFDAALPAVLVVAGVLDDVAAARESALFVRSLAEKDASLVPLADNVDALVATIR